MSVHLTDFEAERAVLGSALLVPGLLSSMLNEGGLRPEHFMQGSHAKALQAMAAIHDDGRALDGLTLRAEVEQLGIERDAAGVLVGDLTASVPDPANWRAYAERVRDLHRRRQIRIAAALLVEAADTGNDEKISEAEVLLTTPEDRETTTWSARERADRYFDRRNRETPITWRWPFRELDQWTGGGLRRQQVVLIGGWTSNGKSVFYDQVLDAMADQGLRVHSYINEMSEEERTDRAIARMSGVPFWKIQEGVQDPRDADRELEALSRLSIGVTECAGWTATEIARHIKWNQWDVAGVDIVHEIPHDEQSSERGMSKTAQTLRIAAKQANCALVACVHLNDNRVTTPRRPPPVLRDIRDTGMLARGADIVLFVHRDDDEHGIPTSDGMLFAAKVRNGSPNAMAVVFDAQRLRFLPMARA